MKNLKHRFRPRVEALEGRDVPTATFTTLLSHPDPSVVGQPVTFTALVSGGDFQPGSNPLVNDTVSFYADSSASPFATVPVVNGQAAVTVFNPPAGLHAITADYSGGVFFQGRLLVNDSSWSGVLLQETDQPGPPPQPVPVIQLPAPQPMPLHHHGHAHHAQHHAARPAHHHHARPDQ